MKKSVNPFDNLDIYKDYAAPLGVEEKDFEMMRSVIDKFVSKLEKEERGEKSDFRPTQEEIDAFSRFMSIKKEEIALTRPEGLELPSDAFYADVANEIYMKLMDVTAGANMPGSSVRDMSIACAIYLEDIVSEIGVWNAIRNIFLKKLGRKLPFYDCSHEEYYDDDINKEDIMFIMWQSMCRAGQSEKRVFSPLSELMYKGSDVILDILADKFDDAPASNLLRDYIRRCVKKADDYYPARMLSEWLASRHPLLKIPDLDMWIADMQEAYEEQLEMRNSDLCHYWAKCYYSWERYIGPMGCSSAQYVAELCRIYGNEASAALLDKLECIKIGEFNIIQADRKGIVLQGIDGEKYDISIKSVSDRQDFMDGKAVITSLVKFGDKWWTNGVAHILTERVNKENPKHILYVPEKTKKYYRKIIEENGGRQVFYFKNYKEVSEFMGMKQQIPYMKGRRGNVVLFLSKNSQPRLGWDIAKCFNDPQNPYYKKRTAEKEAFPIIMTYDIEDDVALYIEQNNLLPDANINMAQGKEEGHRIIRENLRFLCGFYRMPVYESEEEEYEDE